MPTTSPAGAADGPGEQGGAARLDTAVAALVVLAVLAFAAAFTWLGPVLKPFLVAVFLYYVIRFCGRMLVRAGLGPRTAFLGVLAGAAGVGLLVGQLVARESRVFLAKWPKYEARIGAVIERLPRAEWLLPDLLGGAPAADERTAEGDAPAAPEAGLLGTMFRKGSTEIVNYALKHSLAVVEVSSLVLVYLVFLFIGDRKLPLRLQAAFPGDRGARLLRIGSGITDSMERFMAVKTVVGLGMGATAGLIMLAFGLDHWLLWAFLFFASNYITYIGSIAACVPPLVLAFFDLDQPVAAAILAALLVLNRVVWIDFVEIRMSGRELNLDPTLMFLWLTYWYWVWGVLGLLLAYPMLAALKIVLTHAKGSAGWAVLLSDEH